MPTAGGIPAATTTITGGATVVFTSVHVTVPLGTDTISIAIPAKSLTTIFTPPVSCLTDVYDISGSLLLALAAQSECYPNGTLLLNGTYSPGICPSGYAAVPVTVSTPPAGIVTAQNKTGGICCPQ